MLGLNPGALLGLALGASAIFGSGVMLGHNNGYASAMKEERSERTRGWVRELALWSLIADTNKSKAALIRDVENWMTLAGKARAEALKAIRAEKAKAQDAASQAEVRITELLNAVQSPDWAGTPVDPVIVCGMRGDTDCGDDTAGRTAGDDDLELRQ